MAGNTFPPFQSFWSPDCTKAVFYDPAMFSSSGDRYYFVFGQKKVALLVDGGKYATILEEAEVAKLPVLIRWTGGDCHYEADDEVSH